MSDPTVLLVDDDAPIRRMLRRTLAAEGYDVAAVADGGAALAQVERSLPDLIVLDVALPGLDGLAVTRRLREKGLPVPILLLTARDALAERVAGLDAGADDYFVKPFEVDELTRREAQLLELLLRNAGTVVTRELALDEVWGADAEAGTNVVDRYDLLALAREDAAAPAAARGEEVALAELARTVAARDAGARVVVEPDAEHAAVQAEPVALERAVGNLVHNARTHGPQGGAITITIGLSPDGTHARVTVADEGPGLVAEQARHAFERFWRGDGARAGGSGLGLAIARATAERHGGSVGADGPRFTIELPAIRDLSDCARRRSAAPRTADPEDRPS